MATKPFNEVREESLSRGVLKAPVRREALAPEEIVIPPRLRAGVNDTTVLSLMEGIKSIGLQTPITVRIVRDGDEETTALVAGRHRLEACLRLGIKLMDCNIFEGSEDEARLWEIAENLHRSELTEPERRQHIAEWVKLTADRVFHGGTPMPGGAQPKELGIRKASKELGLSVTAVKRAVDAESLDAPVKEVADEIGMGTVARAELAKAPVDEQINRLNELKAAKTARLLAEEEAKEVRKLNSATDTVVKDRRIEAVKEWLNARLDVNEMHQLGEMLAGICDPLSRAMMREAA